MRTRIGIVMSLLLLVAPPVSADPDPLWPPFDAPIEQRDCEVILAVCTHETFADASTGALTVAASVDTTDAPVGSAWSSGMAGFQVDFDLDEPATTVEITFEVLVHEADVEAAPRGSLPANNPYGVVAFLAFAVHNGCSCGAIDYVGIAGAGDPDHRRDQRFRSTMTLARNGRSMPAGSIQIGGVVEAWAGTGNTVAYAFPGSGAASARAGATITSLTVDPS